MKEKLDHTLRYLQIAFNYDLSLVLQVLPTIEYSDRVLIEAGKPSASAPANPMTGT